MIDQVLLEKIKIALVYVISEQLLEAEVLHDYISDQVRLKLQGILLGQHPQPYMVRYPADWWQAFKARWFPRWALNRWPVKYQVHVLDVAIVYPDLKIALPDHKNVMLINHHDFPESNAHSIE